MVRYGRLNRTHNSNDRHADIHIETALQSSMNRDSYRLSIISPLCVLLLPSEIFVQQNIDPLWSDLGPGTCDLLLVVVVALQLHIIPLVVALLC